MSDAEVEFREFQKIPRLVRGMTVTEKIDGTNAQVHIDDTGTIIRFGSRSRWITPEADNYGFARWGMEHREELLALGPGSHFGEWWGAGIQRRYGLAEKRFSLFNTARWGPGGTPPPACCHVVPVLVTGNFDTNVIDAALESLRANGSAAAPGFMQPEGVVVYLAAARAYFKRTIEKDEEPKTARGAPAP